MQFNKNAIMALLAKSDAELWNTIRSIAMSGGVAVPEAMPGPNDMAKIRAALVGASSDDLANAMRIIDEYRRRK